MKKLVYLLLCLGITAPAYAQFPTNSFAVTSACPGSAGNPSVLQKINTDGSLTPIGTVHAGSTSLIINALGNDVQDQENVYGMNVVQPITLGNFNTPPTLYRISLATAEATALGQVTPPPAPTYTDLQFGEMVLRQTFNFIGDGDNQSNYFVGGITVRYSLFSGTVKDPRLYVGQIKLNPFTTAAPVWRQLDTSDPNTTTVMQGYATQIQAFIDNGFNGPAPEGGIQDWVFDPFSGHLVSCLGKEGMFLSINNITTTPTAVTTAPTQLMPTTQDIGSMFTDRVGNIYAVDANDGTIYKIDRTTGNYSGKSYGSALGCNRGDAVSFADALPLPVELTSFTARLGRQGVALAWATASEKNAAAFQLERSPDGVVWQAWRSVPATNRAAGAQYSALDAVPLPGTSYYRLAMHDQDGTTAYSPVQTIENTQTTTVALQLYPNPVRHTLTVLPAAGAGLQVVNSRGQVVWQQASPSTTTHISVDAWPAGLYYVRSQTNALLSQKVVVEH